MSSTQPDAATWSDFENLRHTVKSHTVDRLKQIIAGLTEECNAQLSKSGKKQELIDRITSELDKYRYKHETEHWIRARTVLHQVRTSGMYTSTGSSQTFTPSHNFAHNIAHGSAYASPRAAVNGHHSASGGSSSSIGRYDPYAPPRRPIPTSSTSSPSRTNSGVSIRFKSSPFYKVDQAVSSVVECPESTGSMDRRSQTLQFSLSQEHINKLSQPGSKYQLRLYCTTNTFYAPSPTGFRSNTGPCPIEFPATCEVRVNNTLLQANLKGIKKKPGTAPPADLSKTVRMNAGVQNRVDMIYVNSQANSGPKKFFLVVFLVEVSTVDQLVDRLRKSKSRTSDEVKAQMVKSSNDDDEIVIGKQTMSLKCPLSYTRIKIPCRSDKCVHPQCFDAYSWYSVMEQTTTWLCPVCEKALISEELIVDGYFGKILDQTPDSVDEVEVEPDGEWHTGDNKYGSAAWIAAYRSKAPVKTPSAPQKAPLSNGQARSLLSSPTKVASSASASASRSLEEVVILDSDSENEDEGRVKKEFSPSTSASISMANGASRNGAASSVASGSKPSSSAVIDLTLDSDTEDAPPVVRPPAAKRKVSELLDRADEAAYKKSRTSDGLKLTTSRKEVGNGYPTRGTPTPIGSDSSYASRTLPPLTRQVSVSSTSTHPHHSPPIANSPPVYYATHPQPSPAQNARPFIPYNGLYPAPATSGGGVNYNGAADGSRQVPPTPAQNTYRAYLPRANGSGGSQWP